MIVVSDATPLIALSKIEKLSLLQWLFGGLHLSDRVYEAVLRQAGE